VEAAQEDAVLDACLAAAGPVNDVVDVAPSRWSVTAGEAAVPVASGDSAPPRLREQPVLSPDVEGLAGGSEDDAAYGGVTCNTGDTFGREHRSVLSLSNWVVDEEVVRGANAGSDFAAGELVVADVDYELGPIHRCRSEFQEPVGAPLGEAAVVLGGWGAGIEHVEKRVVFRFAHGSVDAADAVVAAHAYSAEAVEHVLALFNLARIHTLFPVLEELPELSYEGELDGEVDEHRFVGGEGLLVEVVGIDQNVDLVDAEPTLFEARPGEGHAGKSIRSCDQL